MNISLSSETQRLLEAQMKKRGYATPDDAVRVALETMDQLLGEDIEALDTETAEAIAEGEAQAARGADMPWEEVKERLRNRFRKS